MGLVKRRLYKPERKAARKKGVLSQQAPLGCLDANEFEIASALYSLCAHAGIIVGRGADYDALKDVYTVIGKSRATGKAQDVTCQGAEVAFLINLGRQMNGGAPTPGVARGPLRTVGLRG